MNNYQFANISRTLQKEHGKFYGEPPERYTMMFACLEGNALKIHREYPSTSDARMLEAINLVLHTINGYITGEMPDLSKFENEENLHLKYALQMAIDPFANEEIKAVLLQAGDEHVLESREYLKTYFHVPILCLMKIQDSVQFHSKNGGSNGYFNFLERFMGKMISKDGQEMRFSIAVSN